MNYSDKHFYVYILTNKKDGVLYIGVTNNLFRRGWQHCLMIDPNCFTARYKTNKLVYYESYKNVSDAIAREKQLKGWHRSWKINLIISKNSEWNNLFELIEVGWNINKILKQVQDDK